jgi:hypothetical protein
MKKLLTSIALIVALNSFGQTIDTTIKYITAAQIVPVIYKHDLPVVIDTLTHLGVFNYEATDSTCNVSYAIIASNPTRNILFGWYNLTKDEFAEWDKTLIGLFPFIANKFSMTFK